MTNTPNSPATVVISYGRQILIETAEGDLLRALARGRKLQVVCGDRVNWQTQKDGTHVIESIEPRHGLLMRHDVRLGKRLLAANVDRLLVVLAAEPAPDLSLLDCYLVAAESLGIEAALVFNKVDLLDGQTRTRIEANLKPYTELNYPLYWTSASSKAGIAPINAALGGHCGVLVGQSGVGKSSLINALVPDHAPRTQTLSVAAGTGRHTTTATRLYHLPDHSGQVIDSPGVRDFRIWTMPAQEFMYGFREFREYLGLCKFNNCLHISEPECPIRDAVADGRIDQRRYDSYCRLLEQVTQAPSH